MVRSDPGKLPAGCAHARASVANQATATPHAVPAPSDHDPHPLSLTVSRPGLAVAHLDHNPCSRPVCAMRIKVMRKGGIPGRRRFLPSCPVQGFTCATESEKNSCFGSQCSTTGETGGRLGRFRRATSLRTAARRGSEMHEDDLVRIQRQAVKDYRLALGLELKNRRTAANLGFAELSMRTRIPVETL